MSTINTSTSLYHFSIHSVRKVLETHILYNDKECVRECVFSISLMCNKEKHLYKLTFCWNVNIIQATVFLKQLQKNALASKMTPSPCIFSAPYILQMLKISVQHDINALSRHDIEMKRGLYIIRFIR